MKDLKTPCLTKKYNKFTLRAKNMISYNTQQIQQIGFQTIEARWIDGYYYLSLYTPDRKRLNAKKAFGAMIINNKNIGSKSPEIAQYLAKNNKDKDIEVCQFKKSDKAQRKIDIKWNNKKINKKKSIKRIQNIQTINRAFYEQKDLSELRTYVWKFFCFLIEQKLLLPVDLVVNGMGILQTALQDTPNFKNFSKCATVAKELQKKLLGEEKMQIISKYRNNDIMQKVQDTIKKLENFYKSEQCAHEINVDIFKFLTDYQNYILDYKFGDVSECYLKDIQIQFPIKSNEINLYIKENNPQLIPKAELHSKKFKIDNKTLYRHKKWEKKTKKQAVGEKKEQNSQNLKWIPDKELKIYFWLIFYSDQIINFIKEQNVEFFFDGMHGIGTTSNTQAIFGLVQNEHAQTQMVFTVITNDSSQASYERIINHFESIIGPLDGKILHCDLELSLLNAVQPKMIIQPCLFHYTKTIETKKALLNRIYSIKNMATDVNTQTQLYLWLSYFLNEKQRHWLYDIIKKHSWGQIDRDLVSYMWDTIDKWYGKYLNNNHVQNLTNNIAERFMLKLRQQTKQSKISMFKFITNIIKIQTADFSSYIQNETKIPQEQNSNLMQVVQLLKPITDEQQFKEIVKAELYSKEWLPQYTYYKNTLAVDILNQFKIGKIQARQSRAKTESQWILKELNKK